MALWPSVVFELCLGGSPRDPEEAGSSNEKAAIPLEKRQTKL